MSYKRSRAAFEEELQSQQSPYVAYGTPLPPLDPAVRDDGSYVPIWKQEVTDERGRKRLHGAFTGGFSAGYFNTVGSKEGWTPASFVSSKSKRKDGATVQQKPEDFMDDEDLAEAEESRKLATTDIFNALGSTASEFSTRGGVMDLFPATGDTMGLKLLRKMGWKDGQGIGPKVRRKARINGDEEEGEQGETHLFAPEDSKMISFVRKNDHKGLGFEDQDRLEDGLENCTTKSMKDSNDDDFALSGNIKSKSATNPQRGGFGVGVLNDNGSDDEDPYHVGPQISYNRVLGGDKKKKKKTIAAKPSANNANPLLRTKPIFISKRATMNSANFRKCHDGRLPLSGFVLSSAPLANLPDTFPGPEVPAGWEPSTTANSSIARSSSTAQQALTPSARSAILGEAPLPSKSVFSYLKPSARDRISQLTNNAHLPPALSELPPHTAQATASQKAADQLSLIPPLDPVTAAAALSGGFMPYADDHPKRSRYLAFLDLRAHSRPKLPDRRDDISTEEWIAELREFADAARIFRPVGGAMANRFTASSTAARTSTTDAADETLPPTLLLTVPAPKPADPAEEAARMGMFGRLTRRTEQWAPNRLLCKRFNVRVPEHVAPDDVANTGSGSGGQGARNTPRADDALDGRFKAGGVQISEREGAVLPQDATSSPPPPAAAAAPPKRDRELLGHREMEELRASARAMGIGVADVDVGATATTGLAVDPSRNEALEGKKAGEAVFRAIFGDDSEDE